MRGLLAGFGPAYVEPVPITHFTKTRVSLEDAWSIIGPSVEKNISAMPMWKVIAAAYLEGLQHGAAATHAKGGTDDGQ